MNELCLRECPRRALAGVPSLLAARMHAQPHVFLIPGFLGFAHLGSIGGGFPYFCNAAEVLREACSQRGLAPTLVRVETLPTSSLRIRAGRLAEVIAAHAGGDDRPIHLVAHSTGGLDARLLLTPGASLPVDFDLEPIARRVRSLVTIATPHMGTPLASFFDGLFGQRVLWLASLCAVHMIRFGSSPARVLKQFGSLLGRGPTPQTTAALEQLGGELLDALPADKRAPLVRMLENMGRDQALIPQLTPEGVEVLLAATGDRPGVRYGCVVARAPRPGVKAALRVGAWPAPQATFAIFSALHRLTARTPMRRQVALEPRRVGELSRAFGAEVTWADSDGIVPTLSQVWGEVVAAVHADHLDVVGHFADKRRPTQHHDWLVSGSGFDRAAFSQMWRDVAGFMAASSSHALATRRAVTLRGRVAATGGYAMRSLLAFALYGSLARTSMVEASLVLSWLVFAFALALGFLAPWGRLGAVLFAVVARGRRGP